MEINVAIWKKSKTWNGYTGGHGKKHEMEITVEIVGGHEMQWKKDNTPDDRC